MMILPKLALSVSSEGGHGGLLCKGMHGQWEVLEHKLDVFRVFLEQLPEGRLKPRAVGSLVVAENRDRDRRVLRPLKRQAGQGELIDLLQLDKLDRLP